jgi:hypothetical protein
MGRLEILICPRVLQPHKQGLRLQDTGIPSVSLKKVIVLRVALGLYCDST